MGRPAGGQAHDANMEHPVVPAAQDRPAEDVQEISIAGRTKMTIPKNKGDQDVASSDPDSSNAQKEEVMSQQDAKSELNAILKRSPSMFTFPVVFFKICTSHVEPEANYTTVQSSSSPSPTAPSVRKRSQSYWKVIPSPRSLSWLSLTSIRSELISNPFWNRRRDAGPSQMC